MVPFQSPSWHCNVCFSRAQPGADISMGCHQCDFDTCRDCYENRLISNGSSG
jgi:hypothetical protein